MTVMLYLILQILEDSKLAIVSALGDSTSDKENVAKCLTRFFESRDKATMLINALTCKEIDSTSNGHVTASFLNL